MRYIESTSQLEVVFVTRDGSAPREFYRYENVRPNLWYILKTASSSVGQAFQVIRNDKTSYPFTKHLISEPVNQTINNEHANADTLEADLKKSVTKQRQPRFNFTKD